jgi:SAM-dependent methyltransferase
MNCPICNQTDIAKIHAKHLPRFFKCPSCSGYYNLERESPFYREEYFTEGKNPVDAKTVFSFLLSFFLFLRQRRIRKNIAGLSTEILDYGCGNGKLVNHLRHRGFNIDGYDPSKSAVKLARNRNLPVYSQIPDKKYGLMMFWHSMEHTDSPWSDLQNYKNHLAPDANLIIAVPNADSLEAKIFRAKWFCYDWPFHRTHFNRKSLSRLLESNGFRIISIDYFNPEYTVSSLTQTFLNVFLPKNVLYGVISNRRMSGNKNKFIWLAALSMFLLTVFSPLLTIFFLVALITKKTAAMVIVAQKHRNAQ